MDPEQTAPIDPEQTAHIGIMVFASMIKSNLNGISIYAAGLTYG